MTIHVFLVEDQPLIRDEIRSALAIDPEFDLVETSGSDNDLIKLCLDHPPDVLLLGLSEPATAAIELIHALNASVPHFKIITLINNDNDATPRSLDGLPIHASVLKEEAKTTVKEVIHKVIQDKLPGNQAAGDELTARELDVLQLAGRGKTNIQIGEELCIAERTVRAHFENIFKKLDANNRTEAVMIAVQKGWLKL